MSKIKFTTNHTNLSNWYSEFFSSFVLVRVSSWLILLFLFSIINLNLFAQTSDDSDVAQQYVKWIQKAIDENRWEDAIVAFNRIEEFSDVSSDISYLYVFVNYINKKFPIPFEMVRTDLIKYLDRAVEVNKWVIYSENHALLCKAQLLVALRKYFEALSCLEKINKSGELAGNAQMRADTAMQRLLALRGMLAGNTPGADPVQFLALFRSEVLLAMDRFPRDPRPLRIFFEYARNRRPAASELPPGDIELLELALKRLPFLLETDPDLAWMAAPFIYDLEYARRLVEAYRAEGLSKEPPEGFVPKWISLYPLNPASIPAALNLGIIDDTHAVEELLQEDKRLVLDKDVIINTYNLLRSEKGREFFTQRLLSYSGAITSDDDHDGYIDYRVFFNSGVPDSIYFDPQQNNTSVFSVYINKSGNIENGTFIFSASANIDYVEWERYPSVKQVRTNEEIFKFGPANLQYAPVTFIELGGNNTSKGLFLPVPALQYIELTRQTLISSCSSITRPSSEIENAQETIYMNRGVILQVVETLNEKQVSVTEFEKGLPVIQHIDLDLDGRMETIRRFRRPSNNYVWQDLLDYRRLVASSESDWSGDGKHKTREVYQLDGSVVYSFDMDGSGEMNYSETGNR